MALSKGLKMASARKGSYIFNIGQLDTSDNGKLKCTFCDTQVQYVSAHEKGASKTLVSAYLKLWPKGEHHKDCKYSVEGFIKLLVAESNEVEGISPIFELQKDGSYLFRMNILIKAENIAEKLSIASDNSISSEQVFRGCNYISNEQQLASYFRSASGVAKLRALIENKNSSDIELLKQLVKIQYKDSFISWNNFYYDEFRYHELFNLLSKRKLPHPVGVKLRIKKREVNSNNFPPSFQCYSEVVNCSGHKLVFIPRIKLASTELANQFLLGNTYLVVAKVWANKVTDEKSTYRNFTISVFNKSQFKKEIDEQ